MIPFVIIRKIFLSIVPLVLFYLLKKIIKNQEPKKRSHLSDFDPSTPLRASKSNIVEGEIVDENSRNR
ncbi:MAG: hypothetical protein Q8P26_04170 [Candidatus Levybacteria bacterium]|nr:hypothetical protein [Candidatus Levybacteria bacterium]